MLKKDFSNFSFTEFCTLEKKNAIFWEGKISTFSTKNNNNNNNNNIPN